jgi:hypothetical protein
MSENLLDALAFKPAAVKISLQLLRVSIALIAVVWAVALINAVIERPEPVWLLLFITLLGLVVGLLWTVQKISVGCGWAPPLMGFWTLIALVGAVKAGCEAYLGGLTVHACVIFIYALLLVTAMGLLLTPRSLKWFRDRRGLTNDGSGQKTAK